MRVALDTNVLVYAEGVNGAERQAAAVKILDDLRDDELVIPAQVLAELFSVLTRRARWPVERARARVLSWSDAGEAAATSSEAVVEAMTLVADHRLSFWDSLVVASAAIADCRWLLTEDMHSGFRWRGLELRNPF